MWKLLEQAAKTATANASEYVSTVQEKAQTLAATVQEEAATLLHAIGTARTGPVDELLYEEVEDYKVFCEAFEIDKHTDEISQILEDDDEIRGLHEQMVPVELSYEEFWSRYFFRREQDRLREQREAERKEKQREQEEAKAAARAALDELQVDDDDEEEFDAASARKHEDERDDLEDARGLRDEADKEEDEATLAQLRELRASRKAMLQWKQKASEYQKQLGVLAAKHEDEKRQLKASAESEYQQLCDRYESKMAEITMQIDDARAVGYNEGIQESEAIVATMRDDADSERSRLEKEISLLRQNGSTGAEGGASMAELDRLLESLTLKEQVVVALEDEKSALEHALAEKEKELQAAKAQAAQGGSEGAGSEETKKEIDLWKARAIKMKKLKDQAEAELQQLKDQQSQPSGSEDTAALHAKIQELAANLEGTQRQLDTVAKEEYERGVAAAHKENEANLRQLQEQVEAASREGEARAAAKYTSEIEQLRSELAALRSSPAVSGDVFAQADAILSSLASPTANGHATGDLLDDSWPVESDAPATAAATPAAPDWGEW